MSGPGDEAKALLAQGGGTSFPTPKPAGTQGAAPPGEVRYPATPPGKGNVWVYQKVDAAGNMGWVETPAPAKAPTSRLLPEWTTADQRGVVSYKGYYDEDGKPVFTDVTIDPPQKGFRMMPVMGEDGITTWLEEPDLPPDTSLEMELQKALKSGDTERAQELRDALSTYQAIVNDMTPGEKAALQQKREADAQAHKDRIESQRQDAQAQLERNFQWEWERVQTDQERQAVQKRFETEQQRIQQRFDQQMAQQELNDNRRQLEWSMTFAANEQERQIARQQWNATFQQNQWEAGQEANRRDLELGLKIQQSPGDWPALISLMRGTQPNKPYTGGEIAPRTWAEPWMQFANKPMPQAPGAPSLTGAGAAPPVGTAAPQLGQMAPEKGQTLMLSPNNQYQYRDAGAAKDLMGTGYKVVNPGEGMLPPTPEGQQAIGAALETEGMVPPESAEDEQRRLKGRHFREDEEIPLFDSPAEAPFPLPAIRYAASKGKEDAIINEKEIPSFIDAGFKVTEKVKLYDLPQFTGGMLRPWETLSPRGLAQAFAGQGVSKARQAPTLGAPIFPSAQGWGRLEAPEREYFMGQIRSQGFPEDVYKEQWARTMPTWGSQGRFRSAPILGGGRRY